MQLFIFFCTDGYLPDDQPFFGVVSPEVLAFFWPVDYLSVEKRMAFYGRAAPLVRGGGLEDLLRVCVRMSWGSAVAGYIFAFRSRRCAFEERERQTTHQVETFCGRSWGNIGAHSSATGSSVSVSEVQELNG